MARRRSKGEGTIFKRTRTRKDGSTYEVWVAQATLGYTDEGKQKRKTVTGRTQAEVLKEIQKVKSRLADGTYSDTKLTLKAFVKEHWLPAKRGEVKPQTVEDYEYQLDKYVLPKIGSVKLANLRPLHVQSMVNELKDEISPQRANKCRRILTGVLKQAVRWQLIPRNPCDAVKPQKVEKKEIKVWTSSEASRFLDSAKAHRLYAFFYLAMSTGMRRGELLGLRWSDIEGHDLYVRQNLIEQRGKIMFSTTKTPKGYRRVDISNDVIEVLEEHRRKMEAERREAKGVWLANDLIFVTQVGTPYHPRNLERTWYDLQEQTRQAWREEAEEREDEATVKALDEGKLFPRARLHDLRHLHASVLILIEKRSALEVAERLGHTKPSFTLDTYSHWFDQQRERNPVSIQNYLRAA